MPTSNTAQIPTIIELIRILNPKSILDIGCGWGKYGFLCREYLMEDGYWNMDHTIINAVEGFEKHINEVQKKIYNNIYITDAKKYNSYLDRNYDLIIIIDVFEHFDKETGKEIILNLREKSKYLLISIPRYVNIQHGYTEDEMKFEEHRASWTRKMFKDLGNCYVIPNNARKTMVFYTYDNDIKKRISIFKMKKLFLKFFPYFIIDTYEHFLWMLNKKNYVNRN